MNEFFETTGLPRPGAVMPRLGSVIPCLSSVIPRLSGVIPRLDPMRRPDGIQGYTAFHQILAPTLDAAIKSRHDRIKIFPMIGNVIPPLRNVIPRLDRGTQRYTAFHQFLAPTLDAAINSRHDRIKIFPMIGNVIPPLRNVIPRLYGVIPRLDRGIQGVWQLLRKIAPTLDAAIKSRHDRLGVVPRLDPERRNDGNAA